MLCIHWGAEQPYAQVSVKDLHHRPAESGESGESATHDVMPECTSSKTAHSFYLSHSRKECNI